MTAGVLGYRADDGTPVVRGTFALAKEGDLSEVITFGGLSGIVRRDGIRSASTPTFAEVKGEIERVLLAVFEERLTLETRQRLLR